MQNRAVDQLAEEAELARQIAAAAPHQAKEAEAELYRRLAPRVRLYGRKHLRDDHAAADLAQHVLLMTIQKLRAGQLREPERVISFVFGMCRMVTGITPSTIPPTKLRSSSRWLSPPTEHAHPNE